MPILLVDSEKEIEFHLSSSCAFFPIDADFSPEMFSRIKQYFVDLAALIPKEEFDQDYLNLISALGKDRHSKYWWANSLSEKNEFLSKFYQRLFYFNAIKSYQKANPSKTLIVFCQDREYLDVLRRTFKISSSRLFKFKNSLKNFLRLVVKVKLIKDREILKIIANRIYLKKNIERIKNQSWGYAIRTIIDRRNYKNSQYADSYYGALLSYLERNKKPFVLVAEIVQDYSKNLKKLAKDKTHIFLTTESFLKIRDVLKTVGESLIHRPKIHHVVFRGEDITLLIKQELDECFFSAKFLENLLYFTKAESLAKHLHFEKYLYTFENYAWERLGILAMRTDRRSRQLIGFQHAFVAKNSFRYFPGQNESSFMPLPDVLVSIGEKTRDILNKYGDFTGVQFSVGCALRQEKTLKLERINRTGQRNIFVPLTITVEDSVRVITFLYQAGLSRYPYSIFIRFHPLTPVNQVLKNLKFNWPENFIISKNISLEEEFKRAGIVLYTWTTVCLEALWAGLPVIYLDLNFPLNVDPVFEINDLKASVRKPEKLLPEIEGLLNLENSVYEQAYKKAKAYIQKYFFPVTDENLSKFVHL